MVDPEAASPTDPLRICEAKLEQSRLTVDLDERMFMFGDLETGLFINDWEDDAGYFYIVGRTRSDQLTALQFIVGEFAFLRVDMPADSRTINHRFMLVLEDGRVIDYPTDPDEQYYSVDGDFVRPLMPNPDSVRREIDQFLAQYEELPAIDTLDLFSRLAVSVPYKM